LIGARGNIVQSSSPRVTLGVVHDYELTGGDNEGTVCFIAAKQPAEKEKKQERLKILGFGQKNLKRRRFPPRGNLGVHLWGEGEARWLAVAGPKRNFTQGIRTGKG